MARPIADAECNRRRRNLRLRIGRLRRRLDGRAHAARRHALRLISWRSYVRRYPGYSFLAALGLGMSVSAGLGGGRWARLLVARLLRRMGENAGQELWIEVQRIWRDSAPRPSKPRGGEDA